MRDNKYINAPIFNMGSNLQMSDVIFRIIKIKDTYYFAEEISTGCIFPIFNCTLSKNTNKKITHYYSFVNNCVYGVFFPLIGSNNEFNYILDENDEDFSDIGFPNKLEVANYLKTKKKDLEFQQKIKDMESKNEFFCDINFIKDTIKQLQNSINLPDCSNNPVYEEYVPSIDFSSISNFGYDLSSQKDLCNLIGRKDELKKIIKTTCIREKSIILIGESGSGKTSIVEKLAFDIKNKENEWLNDKLIFSLNLSALQADTQYRGEFEKNINSVIDFCKNNQGRIILFIDEIHNLYGLGRTNESSIDAMNILKPYISNGIVVVIGATTKEEYEKYMANDPAFLRRFEKIDISLPDKNMNIDILLAYIKSLEAKYNIQLNINESQKREIVEYIVDATDTNRQRIINDIKITNPTLSKYVIEDAFVEAVYNKKDSVSIDDICLSIISCDKLSPTARKETAELLKASLNYVDEVTNNPSYLVKVK